MRNSLTENDAIRVVAHQAAQSETLSADNLSQAARAESAISESEALLERLGIPRPQRIVTIEGNPAFAPLTPRSWDSIVADARADTPQELSIFDLLPPSEIEKVVTKHQRLNSEFNDLNRLDALDWMTCGIAGTLGALIDIFLVKSPCHPGFLGGPANDGGFLSNTSKRVFTNAFPDEKIRRLESAFSVPFDASTNRSLDEVVLGLGPGTHRFQSLGHDPVLAWIVGVRDLLVGQFTAIGSDGSLVIQRSADPFLAGEHVLTRIFHALRIVGGHLASDVATARGLPAPLMPLLLFIQKGSIGKNKYTIGEVARQMYRMGYDFRHYIASSLSVMAIEAIVRTAFFVRAISDGKPRREAVPQAGHPRLRTQLFVAHMIATAANAGKVAVTKNPLTLNWAQWQMFVRYLLPQMYWALIGQERARSSFIEQQITIDWSAIDQGFAESWGGMFTECGRAVL